MVSGGDTERRARAVSISVLRGSIDAALAASDGALGQLIEKLTVARALIAVCMDPGASPSPDLLGRSIVAAQRALDRWAEWKSLKTN